ncbi:MAG: metallophosphoesterase [Bryobacter sp.]|nr:metallophosphoesterase [Bryobacter sp. CoA8 C33]
MPLRFILTLLCSGLPASAAQLWLPPYVQDVSRTRAVVQWVTLAGGGLGEVRLLPDGPTALSTVETVLPAVSHLSVPIYVHRAELRNLTPGRSYRYEVRLDGAPLVSGRDLTFQTPGDGPVRFLVLGDSGDGGLPQRDLAARLLGESAHFLLHVGDIAYWQGNFRQFAEVFFFIYPELLGKMAFFPVPGNHDYEFQDALAYRTLFTVPAGSVDSEGRGRYYSFDWGPVHFTVIDSNHSLTAALDGSGAMLRWLEQDLAATRQPWRVAAIHHAPFPTSNAKLHDPICALVAQHITPILERHGVQLLLAGHEHIYQRTKARLAGQFRSGSAGTVYITTGGGGSQLYPPGPAPFVALNAEGSHYLRIEADPRQLTVEAVDANGNLKDSTILSSAPILLESNPLHAASFSRDVAAGGLISLLGWNLSTWEATGSSPTLPTQLGGASVTLAGRPLGLLYASRNQLNLLLPQDALSPSSLTLKTGSGDVSLPLSPKPAAPGLFAFPSGSRLLPAALHADGTLVNEAHPASPGEWISLFGTGMGRVNPTTAYGLPAPANPLALLESPPLVQVGGLTASLQFAGLAPGLWGVNQINFQVPPLQGWVKLSITTSGLTSNILDLPVR